ncbi:MAG TPA: acyl carrier protein, partial [Candidatus Eisenbacteria bacterium]|nr:acyl carrier protein [Candidatus Eisenbacteria bacterium]
HPAPLPVAFDVRSIREPVPPPLRSLSPARMRRAAPTAPAEPLLALLGRAPAERRRDLLMREVRTGVAAVLGHGNADDIDGDRGFFDLGFDSLTAVELRNRLNAALALRLPTTVLFDYPTAVTLTDHLLSLLAPKPARPPVLADWDSWENEVRDLAADAPTRTLLAARLQQLLDTLRSEGAKDDSGPPALDGASDEEVFALLDRAHESNSFSGS